jgi:hypothetical protein
MSTDSFVCTQINDPFGLIYLIVGNKWGGKVKQHVLLRHSRFDELLASGHLAPVIPSQGPKHPAVLSAQVPDGSMASGVAGKVFHACGVALPSALRSC